MIDRVVLVSGYLDALHLVESAGFTDDVDWAEGLARVKVTPHYALREGAWVIVNSGFRFAVARKLWPRLAEAFHRFDPERVDRNCIEPACHILNYPRKVVAIVDLAAEVRHDLPGILRDAADPPRLARLPFIGKVTCWHFAKLLGADVVKPDVHLVRAAEAAGAASPLTLCEVIRDATGDRLTVVDSVLWRYGEQRQGRGWPDWAGLWTGQARALRGAT